MGSRWYLLEILFGVVSLASLGFAIYATFYYAPQCESFECFRVAMEQCNRVTYLNDDVEATWKYSIIGVRDDSCAIEVTLLQPKQGELGLERLSDLSMECRYSRGSVIYPEKDLRRCHGILKEELQGILIAKLHTYLLENLGQFNENLRGLA